MNEHFVNIKVDREERPDIDSIYMSAVQALTRHGGWPMTVFLTPDGAPFYGGTYFPPVPSRRHALLPAGPPQRRRRLREPPRRGPAERRVRPRVPAGLDHRRHARKPRPRAHECWTTLPSSLLSQLDRRFGGFGAAPKFPQAMNLEVLLRHHHRTGDRAALDAVELTLRRWPNGGIYDQLGGGFARYSVDAFWLVPHFEKMLYDNALLSRLYLEAYQATGDAFYRRIAEETLDYVLRDMTSPEGGFYSAEDADSEGEEGKFYVWTPEEMRDVLDPDEAALAERYWDVTERGNFEGKSILHVPRPPEAVAAEFGLSAEELWRPDRGRSETKLFAAREGRVRPGRDEKVLAAWNGLMLRSFAFAARVAGARGLPEAAVERTLTSCWRSSARTDASTARTRTGGRGSTATSRTTRWSPTGSSALYEATFDARWLVEAQDLMRRRDGALLGRGQEAFYDTPADHEELVTRPRDVYDSAAPSGTSVATEVLLRLALCLDRQDYRARAEAILEEPAAAWRSSPAPSGASLPPSTSRPRAPERSP